MGNKLFVVLAAEAVFRYAAGSAMIADIAAVRYETAPHFLLPSNIGRLRESGFFFVLQLAHGCNHGIQPRSPKTAKVPFLPIVLGLERREDVQQRPIQALHFLIAIEYFLHYFSGPHHSLA